MRRRKINGSRGVDDRRIPYIYSPAITPDAVQNTALLKFAKDYFDNSLDRMAEALERLRSRRG